MSDKEVPFPGPAASGGKTISVPRPGGTARRAAAGIGSPVPGASAIPRAMAQQEPAGAALEVQLTPGLLAAGNPLLVAAGPLLGLVRQLRPAAECADPTGLRDRAADAVRRFEAQTASVGIPTETVRIARYLLCTVIDETVLTHPWGAESLWSTEGLLCTFYNDVHGGERFFQILDGLAHEPARNIDLLELIYACLRLGFQGRYRPLPGGVALLQQVERNLFEVIRRQRGTPEADLSPAWQPLPARKRRFSAFVPLWVVAAAAGLLLTALYAAFSFSLSQASDAVADQMADLGGNIAVPRAVELPPPVVQPSQVADDLPRLLQLEVERGILRILDRGSNLRIATVNLDVFSSGQDQVRETYRPLFQRIAAAVKDRPGAITVTGHTDNQPIARSLTFPSNHELSLARARAVSRLLEAGGVTRVVAEGKADREPVSTEDTPAARQANRRVEIDVPKQPTLPTAPAATGSVTP